MRRGDGDSSRLSRLLGSLFDLRAVDEVHVFISPRIIGGAGAPSPVAGPGLASIADALRLDQPVIQHTGDDLYLHGRILR